MLVTAAKTTSLLELLYVLFIDYTQTGGGKPLPETATEINSLAGSAVATWSGALPSLRDTLLAVLKGKDKEEWLAKLGFEIRDILPQAKRDGEVKAAELEVLNSLGKFFRTDSEVAATKIRKMASITKSPWVVQSLTPEASDQSTSRNALQDLVESLTGRKKSSALTMDEAKQVKELKPDQYRTYLDLRKEYNQSWKDALVAYIRSSGEHEVDYSKALEYLKLNGIEHMLPTGFEGKIDDLGRMYTSKGKQIDGVPNAVTFPQVVMNKNYGKGEGNDWVFMARRANGEPGPYFYTSDFKKGQAKEKFSKVSNLAPKIDAMRKKWFAQVKHFDVTKPACVAALVLELLYEFSARIGSLGNAAGGKSTYGICTLLCKHVIVDPNGGITLRYKGKDGVNTVHRLLPSDPDHRIIIHDIMELIQNKGPSDFLFTVNVNGKQRRMPAGGVNNYWRSLGAGDTTVHKIRTVAGTKLFQEMTQPFLDKYAGTNQISEKAAMQFFKKAAEAVGKKLNHVRRGAAGTKITGTTALASYIDPSAQLVFWRALGHRPPKFLEKFDV